MDATHEHAAELKIPNRMGFHVRPVQRFAELARVFKADVQVTLHGRRVPGKSVMNLMSLGGRCGDKMEIRALGEDARQCVAVLKFLAENHFFVEDEPGQVNPPDRHVCRLAYIASCFDSEITATVNGTTVDAKRKDALLKLDMGPSSKPRFEYKGADAEQARAIVENLVNHFYYVEEEMARQSGKAKA
jgi:phosphotransferase system HPr (HPr) family protein